MSVWLHHRIRYLTVLTGTRYRNPDSNLSAYMLPHLWWHPWMLRVTNPLLSVSLYLSNESQADHEGGG